VEKTGSPGPAAWLNPYLSGELPKTKTPPDRLSGRSQTARTRTERAEKTGFSSLLEKMTAADADRAAESPEEAVARLLDEVHSAGDALIEKPFIDEIKRYKTAVRGFMSYVLENGFDIGVDEGVPASQKPGFKGIRGSPESRLKQPYSQVRVVDEKLEQLAAGIISGQLKQMDILAGVEEINGLLIDFLG
jgi:uncharacterized protein YaaR (DUF327 family)